MAKKILISGGARSGKSEFAEKICEQLSGRRTYIATAIPFDKEMKVRILKHKKRRDPSLWHNTVEEPYNLVQVLENLIGKTDIVLIDCITIWLNNLLLKKQEEQYLFSHVNSLVNALKQIDYNIVLVSNEVGMGIVPENKLARIFRDISGFANRKIANVVDEFYLVFSGYSIKLK